MSAAVAEFSDEGTLVCEQRFAIVPEWIMTQRSATERSGPYALPMDYGQPSGQRLP